MDVSLRKLREIVKDRKAWRAAGKPGVLHFMGSQRVKHDWATEQQQNESRTRKWNCYLSQKSRCRHLGIIQEVILNSLPLEWGRGTGSSTFWNALKVRVHGGRAGGPWNVKCWHQTQVRVSRVRCILERSSGYELKGRSPKNTGLREPSLEHLQPSWEWGSGSFSFRYSQGSLPAWAIMQDRVPTATPCGLEKQQQALSILNMEVKSKSLSCVQLWETIVYTVHGILQTRTLEWVAFPFSRGSSRPKDRTQVSCIAGRFFTSWATRKAPSECGCGVKSTPFWIAMLRKKIKIGTSFWERHSLPGNKACWLLINRMGR